MDVKLTKNLRTKCWREYLDSWGNK